MLRTIEKTRVSESAVEQIVELIRSGNFAPGEQLPGERQLAKTLDISRNSVREALRKLETIGLLEIRQGLGTFVKDPSSEVLRTALVPHFFSDPKTIEKLFEVREIIEVEAAARAAQRINDNQLQKLHHWLATMETSFARDDFETTVVADVEFHRQILIATENDILIDLMDNVVGMLRDMRRLGPGFIRLLPDSLAEHRAILAALKAHDSEDAKEAMRVHLAHVRRQTQALAEEE